MPEGEKTFNSIIITSFDIKGIVHKEFVPKGQTEFRVLLRSFAATA